MIRTAIPEFRKSQIQHRVEQAGCGIESQVHGAYDDGFTDGVSSERRYLIERLREYEKDSIVAKLIAEMLHREDKD